MFLSSTLPPIYQIAMKEFAKSFYKSKAWQDVRQYVLLRDFNLCVRCGRAAEEVHHIVRLNPQNIKDPLVALNPDNLESLCHECHTAEHERERTHRAENFTDAYIFDSQGMLVRKAPPQGILHTTQGRGTEEGSAQQPDGACV